MTAPLHPSAPHHLPAFAAPASGTDVLMVVMGVFLLLAVLAIGLLFLRLHTLPERIAHRGHKLQFEIVAVLGLVALFTHMHIFWIAGLLLALIDIPNFGGTFNRIAASLETMAGARPMSGHEAPERSGEGDGLATAAPPSAIEGASSEKEQNHA